MIAVFLAAAFAMLALALPYAGRVVAGPSIFDRVVGLNGLGTKIAVLLVLSGVLYGRAELFLDLALSLFLLNLATTLVVARYARDRGGAD